RQLKAAHPETTARRSNIRLTLERGLSRPKISAWRRNRAGKRAWKRPSRFRDRLGGPLYSTSVMTTSRISRTVSRFVFLRLLLCAICRSQRFPLAVAGPLETAILSRCGRRVSRLCEACESRSKYAKRGDTGLSMNGSLSAFLSSLACWEPRGRGCRDTHGCAERYSCVVFARHTRRRIGATSIFSSPVLTPALNFTPLRWCPT